MSFSFAGLFQFAKVVITDVAAGADAIAPIASVIPGGAPIVASVKAATAVAAEAVVAGQSLVDAITPEISQLEALIESLFHVSVTPGALVLTPKTSTGTVSKTPDATKAATAAVQ